MSERLDSIDDCVTSHCALKSLGDHINDREFANVANVEKEIYSELRRMFDALRYRHAELSGTKRAHLIRKARKWIAAKLAVD